MFNKRGFKEKSQATLSTREIKFSLKEPYSEEEVNFIKECIRNNCYCDLDPFIDENYELSEFKKIICQIYSKSEIAEKIISLENGRVRPSKKVNHIHYLKTKKFKKFPF